jgi:hypothetical protein
MIALAIGKYYWDASTCLYKYRQIIEKGLQHKPLTKSWFSWLALVFRKSIYSSEHLESALRTVYTERQLFGLTPKSDKLIHLPRIAVTTTVGTDSRLIASYDYGEKDEYLNSIAKTWKM